MDLCIKKMNIIDTKSDLAFKKVFGEKPHLLMSLLNNFLPLPHPIVEIQYMSPEILPDTDENKNSIVDVRCTDNHGRHFIVEMQVARQTGFNKRVLMNTSKIYSRQLTKNKQYDLAQPVYSLNLLDHIINQNENDWYHYFAFTNRANHDEYWDDMQIIFIELPKWKKMNIFDLNKPQDRWLMYFTEPSLFDRISKEEYERYSEICEALESVEAKNFSPEKIYGYELYVDNIRQYHTTLSLERKAGWKEGVAEGEELGKQIGLETSLQIIQEIKKNILSSEEIAIQFNTNVEIVLSLKSLV
jgi:predicted transposase/invertase (TIGR01784 family)